MNISEDDIPLFHPFGSNRRFEGEVSLPIDIYAPFRVQLSTGATGIFPPQVCWPGPLSTHEKRLKTELTRLQQTSSCKDPPATRAVPPFVAYEIATPYLLRFAATLSLPPPDLLSYMERFFGIFLVDRTATLHRHIPVKVLDPIPEFDAAFATPLDALLHARAREVLAQAERIDMDIKLVWTGDLESSCMVLAFLRVATMPQLHRLLIARAKTWTRPSQWFLFNVVNRHPRLQMFSRLDEIFKLVRYQSQFLVVHATHGDLLVGSDVTTIGLNHAKFGLSESCLRDTWQDVMPEFFARHRAIPVNAKQNWLDWMSLQVAKAPMNIVSTSDFLWWFNFSMTWQYCSLWLITESSIDMQCHGKCLVPFFSTQEIQQWSIHNFKRSDTKRYKDHFSDYLSAYFCCDHSSEMNGVVQFYNRMRPVLKNKMIRSLGISEDLCHIGYGPILEVQTLKDDLCLKQVIETLTTSDPAMIASGPSWDGGSTRRKIVKPIGRSWKQKLRPGQASSSGLPAPVVPAIEMKWAFSHVFEQASLKNGMISSKNFKESLFLIAVRTVVKHPALVEISHVMKEDLFASGQAHEQVFRLYDAVEILLSIVERK